VVGTTTTTYTLDIGTPLTMVIAETTGSSSIYYLHGLGLVAQTDSTNVEYLAKDGLGSVRQVLNSSGSVLMSQTFDPYGNLYNRSGTNESGFGWAGEQADSNGLVFLRARYYNPIQGRFLNTDPSRQETNPYQYSNNNPIKFVDPTGLIREPSGAEFESEADIAVLIIERLKIDYGVTINKDFGYRTIYIGAPGGTIAGDCVWEQGQWDIEDLQDVRDSIKLIAQKLAETTSVSESEGKVIFREIFGGTTIQRWNFWPWPPFTPDGTTIVMTPSAFNGPSYHVKYYIPHEFGHIWDYREKFRLSKELSLLVRENKCAINGLFGLAISVGCYDDFKRDQGPPPGGYGKLSESEDWAQSFGAFIYPNNIAYYGTDTLSSIRRSFITKEIRKVTMGSGQ
jgi:RHS repeat-associated protein